MLLQGLGYAFYSLDLKVRYDSVEELRNLVCSQDGVLLDFSVNLIAKVKAKNE